MYSKNLFENTEYSYEEIIPKLYANIDFINKLENFLQLNWNLTKTFYNNDNNEDLKEKGQQFIDFDLHGIHANNYVGIIKFQDLKLIIYPKVFKKDKDDKNPSGELNQLFELNLHEWAFYYLKYHYPRFIKVDSKISKSEDIFKDLFINIFAKFLIQTLNKKGFFKYEDKTEDLPYLTGNFDIQDYLCKKYSSGLLTQFKCSYSSFEFDNLLNQIIKYTCKKLIKISQSNENKLFLRRILANLSEISNYKFNYKDCNKVKIDKMHADYQIILSMCKMFLLNLTPSYDEDNTQSFCFLFPSELLFEGFISGFIEEHFSNEEGKIKLQTNSRYLIDTIVLDDKIIENNAFNMRLDILYENRKSNVKYILDAKYKLVDSFIGKSDEQIVKNIKNNVKQADLYQLITYALKWDTSRIYLLYPSSYIEDVGTRIPILECDLSNDKKINIGIVKVPYVFLDDNDIKKKESMLIELINWILKIENKK